MLLLWGGPKPGKSLNRLLSLFGWTFSISPRFLVSFFRFPLSPFGWTKLLFIFILAPWCPDVANLPGVDRLAEMVFIAQFIPYVLSFMPFRPGRSGRPTRDPLPSSAYDVLSNVVRKLSHHDIYTMPLTTARRSLKALMRKFV